MGEVQPERQSSWAVYLGLALIAGLIAVGAQFIAGKVTDGDVVTDPTGKRFLRVLAVLGLGLLFVPSLYGVAMFM